MKIKDVDIDTLDDYEIRRFDTVDEAFDFYFDEDETRDSIVKELTADMKKEILDRQHNIFLIDGAYYFAYDENSFDHLKEEVLGDKFASEDSDYERMLDIVEDMRKRMFSIINNSCDFMLDIIRKNCELTMDDSSDTIVKPMSSMSAIFKGKKLDSITLPNGTEIPVTKWKEAATIILKDCNADERRHNMLMEMRGRVGGRNRVILSGNPSEMNVPLKIDDDLYFEGKFDTESLLNVIKSRILDVVGYNYSSVLIKCHNPEQTESTVNSFTKMMEDEVESIIDALRTESEKGYYSVNLNDFVSAQGPQIDIPLLIEMLEENELVDSACIEEDSLVIYSSALDEAEAIEARAAQEENYDNLFNMSM